LHLSSAIYYRPPWPSDFEYVREITPNAGFNDAFSPFIVLFVPCFFFEIMTQLSLVGEIADNFTPWWSVFPLHIVIDFLNQYL